MPFLKKKGWKVISGSLTNVYPSLKKTRTDFLVSITLLFLGQISCHVSCIIRMIIFQKYATVYKKLLDIVKVQLKVETK